MKYTDRYELGRQARCDGEEDAIIYKDFAPGQARCGNCGWHMAPVPWKTGVWCSWWEEHKAASGFCKVWCHPDNCYAGVKPEWVGKGKTDERGNNTGV